MGQNSPNSRHRLQRILKIHQKLTAHRAPNCRILADELGVSTRTIARDIAFMRDSYGLPIDYDESERAYSYTQDVHYLPALQVSEGEVLALFIAEKALTQFQGTPFEQPLRTAFTKLADSMGKAVTLGLPELASALSFHSAGVGQCDPGVFQAVNQAMSESRVLKFDYLKPEDSEPLVRSIHPYHILHYERQWYLIGHDLDRGSLRMFAIPRIQRVLEIGGTFQKPPGFSIEEFLRHSFGIYKGTGDFRVRIEFDPFAAKLVRERHWHETEEIEEKDDGSLILTLKLNALEEIERWVLSWGPRARVIEPLELRARIQTAAHDLLRLYSGMPTLLSDLEKAAQENSQVEVLDLLRRIEVPWVHPGQLPLPFPGQKTPPQTGTGS